MKLKITLACCAASIALIHGGTSYAQDVPATSDDARTDAHGGGIEEIVVTAQKRSTFLQKTPAAITAVTEELLTERGITDLAAVQSLVPSARFQIEQASVQIFIRGVGASLDFGNVQPVVALNLNGVSTPREGGSAAFLDISQVEVLPGPQGTLYGATAMGGTVNISFNRPTNEMETSLSVEGGNYSFINATGIQNIPLSDAFAVRAAVNYKTRSGFLESGADSLKDFTGRLSLLAHPSDDLSIYVWGSHATKDGHPRNVVTRSFDPATFSLRNGVFLHPDNPWDDRRTGALAGFAPFGAIDAQDQDYNNTSVGAELELKLGGATLTSISSYQHINSVQNFWLTSIPATLSQRYNQYTQEIRLAGDAGPVRWLAGLYGSRLKNGGAFALFGGGAFISNIPHHKLDNLSAFGEMTVEPSPDLRLTAGARFSYFKREGDGFAGDGSPFSFEKDYRHVDFKLGVDYDLTDKVMIYAGFQTGYSPGTFNEKPNSATFDNAVKPSKLAATSIGIKSRFLDDAVQLNVEGYYYDYSDLLQQSYDISASFNPIFNPKKTEIYGVQADLIAKPTRDDQLTLSVGYLHGTYKDFVQPNGTDFSGNSIAFAPDWTISTGYSHDFQLSSGYIRARADARYESSYWGDFAHTPGDLLGNFWLVDATLTYYDEGGRWNVGAWVKNLGDKAVPGSSALGGIPGPVAVQLEAPRTFGGRFSISF